MRSLLRLLLTFALLTFAFSAFADAADPTPNEIAGWFAGHQYALGIAAVVLTIVKLVSSFGGGWFTTRWGKLTLAGILAVAGAVSTGLFAHLAVGAIVINAVTGAVGAIGTFSLVKNVAQGNNAS